MFWGKKQNSSSKYLLKHFYEYYKKNSKNPVSKKIFRNVVHDFFEYRMQLIIYDNIDFTLPARFGILGIRKKCNSIYTKKDGTLRYIINWGETNKLWKQMYPDKTPQELKEIKNKPFVYYTNDKVDGKVFDFMWYKFTANFKHKRNYKFEPIRKWKRKLADFVRLSKEVNYYDNF